jgi:hypothetical protein
MYIFRPFMKIDLSRWVWISFYVQGNTWDYSIHLYRNNLAEVTIFF